MENRITIIDQKTVSIQLNNSNNIINYQSEMGGCLTSTPPRNISVPHQQHPAINAINYPVNIQPVQTPVIKSPILQVSNYASPSPYAPQLYGNGIVENKQEFITEKVPINHQKTQFKWIKKNSWFYPPSIKNFNNNIIRGRTFQQKLLWFRIHMQGLRIPWEVGSQKVTINRENLIESSIKSLVLNQTINLHKELKIQFNDEKVNDAGGLEREWSHLVIKEIFHPQTGLFLLCDTQQTAYKINTQNYFGYNKEQRINIFKLLGILLGKVIFDRISIGCHLNYTILRQIVGANIFINDFYSYDAKIYDTFQSMLKGNNCQELGLDYCIYEVEQNENLKQIELIPNGKNIMVSQSNKTNYITECINYYCSKSVELEIKALCQGIYKIIPLRFLSVFQPYQLDTIISGPQFIDTTDWQLNTTYKGYDQNSIVIRWFWKNVHELPQQKLSNLLHYCTGTNRVPVLGFKYLQSNRNQVARFAIHRVDFTMQNPFPKAHTCFNRLQLPEYNSEQNLKEYLNSIVKDQIHVFGLD